MFHISYVNRISFKTSHLIEHLLTFKKDILYKNKAYLIKQNNQK